MRLLLQYHSAKPAIQPMNYGHLRYFWAVAKEGGVLRAAERLHVTPQTISGQIALLEAHLGKPLLRKRGRGLELTPEGEHVLRYADEIFALGAELEQSMKSASGRGRLPFRVGIVDDVPKSAAYRLIEPATRVDGGVLLVCLEGRMTELLPQLAVHGLDLVIANAPMLPNVSVRAFNHRLGQSGVSFFASRELRRRCKGRFPRSLDGVPMLLPGEDSPLTARLQRWMQREHVQPDVVAAFDDGALMQSFGQHGQGVFVGMTVLEAEIEAQYGVEAIGRCDEVFEELYAISVERRVSHPCVAAITAAARDELFAAA
jgi:LysR family transcriptional activator of nhaA